MRIAPLLRTYFKDASTCDQAQQKAERILCGIDDSTSSSELAAELARLLGASALNASSAQAFLTDARALRLHLKVASHPLDLTSSTCNSPAPMSARAREFAPEPPASQPAVSSPTGQLNFAARDFAPITTDASASQTCKKELSIAASAFVPGQGAAGEAAADGTEEAYDWATEGPYYGPDGNYYASYAMFLEAYGYTYGMQPVVDEHGGFYAANGVYYPASALTSQPPMDVPSVSTSSAGGSYYVHDSPYSYGNPSSATASSSNSDADQHGAVWRSSYGDAYDASGAEADHLAGVEMDAPSATELLKMFFPAYSDAALTRLFNETAQGDLRTAFDELCLMEKEAGAASKSAQQQQQQQHKGSKGAAADKHGHPAAAAKKPQQPAKPFKLDTSAFPTLASNPASPSKASAAAPAADAGHIDEASAPAAPAAAPAPANGVVAAKGMSFAERVKIAAAADAAAGANGTPAAAAANGTAGKKAAAPAAAPKAKAAASGASAGPAGKHRAAEVPWVATGAAVSAQYADARSEASTFARARNMFFQQATLAYLHGDKAAAKELARQGRAYNDRMKAAHSAAAARIFEDRNKHLPAGKGAGAAAAAAAKGCKGEVPFIDLHGLHAKEVRQVLEQQLEAMRAAGHHVLRIITGTGHHTKGAKTPARLPVAVQDTLLENHVTFKTLQPGLLEAQL